MLQESEISNIDWEKYKVDVVLECTGKFNSKEKSSQHLKSGAKKVLVSAPCSNADKTIVYGVNDDEISKKDLVISNASCTTNCLAPVAKVIDENFGPKEFEVETILDIPSLQIEKEPMIREETFLLEKDLTGE